MHRLFVAVPLPKELCDHIEHVIESWKKTPHVRWMNRSLWHITLLFLGNCETDSIPRIVESLKIIAKDITPFSIEFDHIQYVPNRSRPRMIWLTTTPETSRFLGNIQERLVQKLEENGIHVERDYHTFNGHITLARFEPLSIHNLPRLGSLFEGSFSLTSLDLMESKLHSTGAKYSIRAHVVCGSEI